MFLTLDVHRVEAKANLRPIDPGDDVDELLLGQRHSELRRLRQVPRLNAPSPSVHVRLGGVDLVVVLSLLVEHRAVVRQLEPLRVRLEVERVGPQPGAGPVGSLETLVAHGRDAVLEPRLVAQVVLDGDLLDQLTPSFLVRGGGAGVDHGLDHVWEKRRDAGLDPLGVAAQLDRLVVHGDRDAALNLVRHAREHAAPGPGPDAVPGRGRVLLDG